MISIRVLTLLTLLAIAFFPFSSAQAAPSISGTSGTWNHDGSVTINGSGFGTYTTCGAPLYCAWVRDWANGQIEQGNWFIQSNNASYSLSSSEARPLHSYALAKVYNGNRLGGYSYFMNVSPNQWFISFWFRLRGPATQSGKFFRIYGDSPSNIYLSTGGGDTEVRGYSEANINPPPATQWGSANSFGYDTWKRVDIVSTASPSNFSMWMSRVQQVDQPNWTPNPFPTSGHTIDVPNMIDDPADSGGADGAYIYSDMYVSQTPARVELCDASTWAACTQPEIQLPTAWSASSITLSVNRGRFADGTSVYLYVCDSTGSCNSSGTSITIASGGGGDTTPPAAPTGLAVP